MANPVVRMDLLQVIVCRMDEMPLAIQVSIVFVSQKHWFETWMGAQVLFAGIEGTDDIEPARYSRALDLGRNRSNFVLVGETMKQSICEYNVVRIRGQLDITNIGVFPGYVGNGWPCGCGVAESEHRGVDSAHRRASLRGERGVLSFSTA